MNKLLEKSFMEERLQKYFRYMESVYGEEVALNTVLNDSTFRSSIAKFSEDFYEYSDLDVNKEFLKVCLLTDKPEDTALKYANTLIAKDRITQLLLDIQTNSILKMAIVENYIRNMYSSSEELYNKAQQNSQYRILNRDLENLEKAFKSEETKIEDKTTVNNYQVKQQEKVYSKVQEVEHRRRRKAN